jgi:hypothetical protein
MMDRSISSLDLERLAALVIVASEDQADASDQGRRQGTPVHDSSGIVVGQGRKSGTGGNEDRADASAGRLPTRVVQNAHLFTFQVWTRSCRVAWS